MIRYFYYTLMIRYTMASADRHVSFKDNDEIDEIFFYNILDRIRSSGVSLPVLQPVKTYGYSGYTDKSFVAACTDLTEAPFGVYMFIDAGDSSGKPFSSVESLLSRNDFEIKARSNFIHEIEYLKISIQNLRKTAQSIIGFYESLKNKRMANVETKDPSIISMISKLHKYENIDNSSKIARRVQELMFLVQQLFHFQTKYLLNQGNGWRTPYVPCWMGATICKVNDLASYLIFILMCVKYLHHSLTDFTFEQDELSAALFLDLYAHLLALSNYEQAVAKADDMSDKNTSSKEEIISNRQMEIEKVFLNPALVLTDDIYYPLQYLGEAHWKRSKNTEY